MNSTSEERIMYYDAEQRKFVVEDIPLDTKESDNTTVSSDTTQSNVSAQYVI